MKLFRKRLRIRWLINYLASINSDWRSLHARLLESSTRVRR